MASHRRDRPSTRPPNSLRGEFVTLGQTHTPFTLEPAWGPLSRRAGAAGKGVASLADMALAVRPRWSLERIAALDERTLQRVAAARTTLWTGFMRTITHTSLWLPLLVGAVAAAGDHSFFFGAAVGGVAAGVASLLVQVVKITVRRARPSVAFCLAKTLDKYSFPSGHSSAAFAVAAASLFLAPMLFPLILLVASVVAYSRVYLGVHYPSDVLTGAVMGTVLGLLTATGGAAVAALSVFLG